MLQSLLPSIVVLGAAALAAVSLALGRPSPPSRRAQRIRASHALALAAGMQTVHFVEEAWTGFPERLGSLLGLPGMPVDFFLVFNLTWIGIWILSIFALRSAHAYAFFAAWFLAIAGMVNGIAHPLLAMAGGQYFPGLISSPFVAAASVFLWVRLRRATAPRSALAATAGDS